MRMSAPRNERGLRRVIIGEIINGYFDRFALR